MKPRSYHYGQKPAATTNFVGPHLRVQVRPGSYAHRSVTGVLACVLGRGFGPGTRIVALHLRAVAAWSAGEDGGTSEARIGIEATPSSQTDEDLARALLEPLLQLHGIVEEASKTNWERSVLFRAGPAKPSPAWRPPRWCPWRAGCAPRRGAGPTLADEVELCDELVGPSGHDRLAEWREGW
jgi:hypothetical protein